MKFKLSILKQLFIEMLEFDEGRFPDDDTLNDYLYDCWEYHNGQDNPEPVSDEEQRVLIREFILFWFKDFDERNTCRLKNASVGK